MPLIKVQTSITEASSESVEALLTTLSASWLNIYLNQRLTL